MSSLIDYSFRKIARVHEERPYFFIAFYVLLSFVFLNFAMQLDIEANMEKMMPQEDPVLKNTQVVRDKFGGSDYIIISISLESDENIKGGVQDIRDPAVLWYIATIIQNIEKEPEVGSVQSVLNFMPYIPSTLEESKLLMANPLARDFVNSKYTMTTIKVQTNVGADDKAVSDLVERIEEDIQGAAMVPGIRVDLTGLIVIRKLLVDLMKSDGVKITVLAFVLIFFALLITLGSVKRGILPLISVTFAILWAAGGLQILGVPLNVMTVGLAPMLMGLGIDYGIHMVMRLREEIPKGPGYVERTLLTTGKALLYTSSTTMMGFGSLLFASMPGLTSLGALGVVGIFFAYIASVLLLPSLFVLRQRYFPEELDGPENSIVENRLMDLATFQLKRKGAFIFVLLVLTGFIFGGMPKLKMESSTEKALPQYLPEVQQMYKVRDEFGGAETLVAIITVDNELFSDIRSPEIIRNIAVLEEAYKDLNYVTSVFSVVDYLEFYNINLNSEGDVRNALEGIQLVNSDYSSTIIVINSDVGTDSNKIGELMDDLESATGQLRMDGLELEFAGPPAITRRTGILMMQDFQKITLIAFIGVFLILFLDFRSVYRSLIVVSPLLIALVFTFGTMGYMGLSMRPETMGLASNILGIGIDYSILTYHRFLESGSIIKAVGKTGRAILASSSTTITGFMALGAASLVGLREMGMGLALGIFFCAVIIILFFPVFISLFEKSGNETKANID